MKWATIVCIVLLYQANSYLKDGVKMRFCPNCNLEFDDRYAFCHQCGDKLQEKIEQNFCPYCGNQIETDGVFCPFCGNSLEESDATPKVGNFTVAVDNSHTVPNTVVSPKNHVEYNHVTQSQSVYEVKDSEEPFLTKHHLLSYDGRRGRMSYLKVQIFWSIITKVLTLFVVPLVFALGNIGILVGFIIDLIFAYPMFCNVSKRMHDLEWPTSWAAILCVLGVLLSYGIEATKPFAGSSNSILYGRLVIVLIFCIPFVLLVFKKGTEGPNRYGQDPL